MSFQETFEESFEEALEEEALEEEVLRSNHAAVQAMTQTDLARAWQELRKALEFTGRIAELSTQNKLLLITYNNLSCYYSKARCPEKALKCLEAAVDLQPDDVPNTVHSSLNMCRLLCSMQQHERALRYALKAVCLLKKSLRHNPRYACTRVLAYHSLGQEYRHLRMRSEAQACFRKGLKLSKRLPPTHPVSVQIRQAILKKKRG